MRKSRLISPNAHLTRDKKWLEARYFGDNLSQSKIAELIPCSLRGIQRCFEALGIPRKPKHITYGDIKFNPMKGEKNGNWKGGKSKCFDCEKELDYKKPKEDEKLRCWNCFHIYNRGEKHQSWKPFEQRKGPVNVKIRNSQEYAEWRKSVLKRDKYSCQICHTKQKPIFAHHLDGFHAFPEKRLDLNNGITLCGYHHIDFHIVYGRGNNTKSQFEEYLETTTEMTY